MKNLLKVLSVVALTLLIASCNKKKEDPKPTNNLTDNIELSYAFKPVKGENTQNKNISLTNFTRLIKSKMSPKKAIVSNLSYIEFSGLKNSTELSGITIQVKNNNSLKRTFAKVSKDQVFKSAEDIAFLQKVVNEMIKSKTTSLNLVLSSNNSLNSEIRVRIKMNVTFWK